MGRTILGAAVGLVVAFLAIMLVQLAGHHVYPPPPAIDPGNGADMAKLIALLPLGALLVVVLAWLAGAFAGGLVAALVARRNRPRVAALVPALMVIAGVVAMLATIPAHPTWMAVAGLLLPIPAALLGAALAGRVRRG